MADIDPYAEWFHDWMHHVGLPVRITETKRSYARQFWLYASGRTRPGPILTKTLTGSRHLTGEAFDFTFTGLQHRQSSEAWQYAGAVVKWMGLVWGGDWKMRDYGHAELPSDDLSGRA